VAKLSDKAVRRQKQRVRREVDRWRAPLGLNAWRIETVYYDSKLPKLRGGKSRRSEDDDNAVVLMRTSVWWEYQVIHIAVNLLAISRLDARGLEATVVHELAHGLVNEMRHYSCADGVYHEERVVTMLANALIWTRDAAAKGALGP
jgi:hypothetical protein